MLEKFHYIKENWSVWGATGRVRRSSEWVGFIFSNSIFKSCWPVNLDLNVGVPERAPCGTPSPPSQMSCGWAAACSPWSCDTLSPLCFRAPQWLPPLQRCSPPRRPRWPRPRCFGSRGDAGGGCLCGGYSRLDSRWPRRTASRPAPSTPGCWPTPSQSLRRRQRHRLLESDHTYKNKLMRIVTGDIADPWPLVQKSWCIILYRLY